MRGPSLIRMLLVLLPLLLLPHLHPIRSSSPPYPEADHYSLLFQSSNLRPREMEKHFSSIEETILKDSTVQKLELKITPGELNAEIELEKRRAPGVFEAKLDRLCREAEEQLPRETANISFRAQNGGDEADLILLLPNRREAVRIKNALARLKGIGKIRLFPEAKSTLLTESARASYLRKESLSLVSALRSLGRHNRSGDLFRIRIQQSPFFMEDHSENSTHFDTPLLNGKPVNIVSIYPGKRDCLKIRGEIQGIIEEMETSGEAIPILRDRAQIRREEIRGLSFSLLIGCICTILLLLLRKESLYNILLIAAVLPLTALPLLLYLSIFGIDLNILLLSAFSCLSGSLIDAAVLVIEEKNGLSKRGRFAAILGNLSSIAACMPLFFLREPLLSVMEEYAMILTIALLSSLLYSIFLLPRLCSPTAKHQPRMRKRKRSRLGVGFALLFFALSPLFLMIRLPEGIKLSLYGIQEKRWKHYLLRFPQTISSKRLYSHAETISKDFRNISDEDLLIIPGEKHLNMLIQGEDAYRHLFTANTGLLFSRSDGDNNTAFGFHLYIYAEETEVQEKAMNEIVLHVERDLPGVSIYSEGEKHGRYLEFTVRQLHANAQRTSLAELYSKLQWNLKGGRVIRNWELAGIGLQELPQKLASFCTLGDLEVGNGLISIRRRRGQRCRKIYLSCKDVQTRKEAEAYCRKITAAQGWVHGSPVRYEIAPSLQEERKRFHHILGILAGSLLSLSLLLFCFYSSFIAIGSILISLGISMLWIFSLLKLFSISLSIPGIGALLFAAGLSVNSSILLIPNEKSPGTASESPPASALWIPAASTIAGVLPLFFHPNVTLLDVPLILCTVSISGPVSAILIAALGQDRSRHPSGAARNSEGKMDRRPA